MAYANYLIAYLAQQFLAFKYIMRNVINKI